MITGLLNQLRRQKRNIEVFRAYGWLDLVEQCFTLPRDLYLREGKAAAPLNVALFITLRCNLRCSMCNLLEILEEKGGQYKEPTIEEVKKLSQELKEMGCPGLILFGGEPFVRNDFAQLVSVVKEQGLTCGTFTNGTLLQEEKIKETVEAGLDYIVFSLLGPKEVHNEITGNEKAFDKLVESARLFRRERQSSVIIHCTITKENVEHLDEVVEVGKEVGAHLVRFGHPTFYTDADRKKAASFNEKHFPNENIRCTSAHYEIKDEESAKYVEAIEQLRSRYGSSIAFSPELSSSEVASWYSPEFVTHRSCLFVYRGCFISPEGQIVPCESFDYPLGNVFEEGFKTVWENERYCRFRQKIREGIFPGCTRCCKL